MLDKETITIFIIMNTNGRRNSDKATAFNLSEKMIINNYSDGLCDSLSNSDQKIGK